MPIATTRLQILQTRKLLQCVYNEDKDQIEKLIEMGIPNLVNYVEDAGDGYGALHRSAANNNEAMIQYLLKLGALPDTRDVKGRTAAMIAAESGHLQAFEILMNSFANMKIKDDSGKGILFYCINNTGRHLKCAELALQNKADPNNIDASGNPVLVLACESAAENEELCMKLLEFGAEPNVQTNLLRKTPLQAAVDAGSVKVARALIVSGANVNAVDKKRVAAVHRAARSGHINCLQLLSAFNADMTVSDVLGNTAIHYAAMEGHDLCIRFLGQRGCPGKQKNNEGSLAKAIAKDEGHKAAMKEARKAERIEGKPKTDYWKQRIYDWICQFEDSFLKQFQDIDAHETEEEKTQGTVTKDQFVDLLSNNGPSYADPEQWETIYGLHDKERKGFLKYEEFLAGKKYVNKNYLITAFKPKEKKKKGKKGKKGKAGKFKMLFPICTLPEEPRQPLGAPPINFIPRLIPITNWEKFDRDHPPPHPIKDDSYWYITDPGKSYIGITEAARMNDFESLKAAFNRKVPVDTRDRFYQTPLMTACQQGNIEMTSFLLKLGADINATDNFFWTPLHFACQSGQLPIVQMLVDAGADVNAESLRHATPFMRAVESSRAEVVEYLLEKGVKLTIENAYGSTVLDVAAQWADPRVFKIINDKFEGIMPVDKKKGKGKGKGKGKKSAKGKGKGKKKSAKKSTAVMNAIDTDSQPRSLFSRAQLDAIQKGASAISAGSEFMSEDISFTPKRTWVFMPETRNLIQERQTLRNQFGFERDFMKTFKMPLHENVHNKLVLEEGVSA